MRSLGRWILLVPLLMMFRAVVSNTESPHKAVPIIVLVVIIWAAWRMTATGKRAGPGVSARDEAKHADVHDAHDCAVHGNTIMAADSTVDTGAATQLYGDSRPVRLADKEPITEYRKSAVLFFDGVPLPDDVHISPSRKRRLKRTNDGSALGSEPGIRSATGIRAATGIIIRITAPAAISSSSKTYTPMARRASSRLTTNRRSGSGI